MYHLCLKDLRRRAGFRTQKSIAERLGIKVRRYASWEREEVALTLEDAFMLAVVLHCTPNDICGWTQGINEPIMYNDSAEQELITCYRECEPQWKQHIVMAAHAAASESKSSTKHPVSDQKEMTA